MRLSRSIWSRSTWSTGASCSSPKVRRSRASPRLRRFRGSPPGRDRRARADRRRRGQQHADLPRVRARRRAHLRAPTQEPHSRAARMPTGALDAAIQGLHLLVGCRLEVDVARYSSEVELILLPAPNSGVRAAHELRALAASDRRRARGRPDGARAIAAPRTPTAGELRADAITDGRCLFLRLSLLMRGCRRHVSGLRRVRNSQPRFRHGGEADACRTGSAADPLFRCPWAARAGCWWWAGDAKNEFAKGSEPSDVMHQAARSQLPLATGRGAILKLKP